MTLWVSLVSFWLSKTFEMNKSTTFMLRELELKKELNYNNASPEEGQNVSLSLIYVFMLHFNMNLPPDNELINNLDKYNLFHA